MRKTLTMKLMALILVCCALFVTSSLLGGVATSKVFASSEITYTITYNLNGGTLSDENPTTYTQATPTIILNNPIKENYEFVGWQLDGEIVTEIKEGSFGNLTLDAVYKAKEYTITYLGLDGAENLNPTKYTVESSFTLQPLTLTNKNFIGWKMGDVYVTEIEKYTTGNITLTAEWEEISYSITYMLDGGTLSQTNPTSYTQSTPTIILNNPTKTNYEFVGWFRDGKKVTSIETGSFGNIILIAVYKANEYDLIYQGVDGIINTNPTKYTVESSLEFHSVSKTGYVFKGWKTLDGDMITNISKGTTGDITLTAVFETIAYDLVYDLNGGVIDGNGLTKYNQSNLAQELPTATKSHYQFIGWNYLGQVINQIPENTFGVLTLKAVYKANEYTVTYLGADQLINVNPIKYSADNGTIVLQGLEKIGYTFDGWLYNGQKVTEISPAIYGDITLQASWKLTQYKIEYELYGGENNAENPASYNLNSQTILLKTPTREGFEFINWQYKGQIITEIKAGSVGDMLIYAVWNTPRFNISYELDGGKNHQDNPTEYISGASDVTFKAPTKYGYTFLNWTCDGEVITKLEKKHGGNLLLVANWELTKFNIDYVLSGATGNSNPMNYTIESGDVILSAVQKNGYTFSHWTLNGNVVDRIVKGSYGDLTLVAHFDTIVYTINYDMQGGSDGYINPRSYTVESVNFLLEPANRPGYDFVRWEYDGKIITELATGSYGDKTIKAIWSVATYVITYDTLGGTNSNLNPTTYTIESANITLYAPTKAGYTFYSWVLDGVAINSIPSGTYGNITLVASYNAQSLTINKTRALVVRGKTIQLIADYPADTIGNVTWYSYDEDVASVNQYGVVKGVSVGKTTILAMIGGTTASCEVSVIEPQVEADRLEIELNNSQLNLNAEDPLNCQYQLSANVYLNGQKVIATLSWQSSNSNYVTVSNGLVKAVKNGEEAIVSVTATYQGVAVTAIIKVYADKLTSIKIASDSILIYEGQTHLIDYSILKDGVVVDDDRTTFSSNNKLVAEVSSDGVITAKKRGSAIITIKNAYVEEYLEVTVGTIQNVYTAEQFMQVDGASSDYKFILQNNIDFGEYLASGKTLNFKNLIKDLNATIDGNGYGLTGLTRIANNFDGGFFGIFDTVTYHAKIQNLSIYASVETMQSSTLIAREFLGTIENCYFELNVTNNLVTDNDETVLFTKANGYVIDSVFNVITQSGALYAISDRGVNVYDGLIVIGAKPTYTAFVNGVGKDKNFNFSDSYYMSNYSTSNNAYAITGDGVSNVLSSVSLSDILSNDVWVISNNIGLINSVGVAYPYISTVSYADLLLSSSVKLVQPGVISGDTYSYSIVDQNGNDVTSIMVENGVFKPQYEGTYTIINRTTLDGVSAISASTIKVLKQAMTANCDGLTLKVSQTFTLQISSLIDSEYYFYSTDESIATVSNQGVIQALKEGQVIIKAVSKTTTNFVNITLNVVNDYIEISTVEELMAIDGVEGKYYLLTNDLDVEMTAVKNSSGNIYTNVVVQQSTSNANQRYEALINVLSSTLDGQGYKINLTFNSNTGDGIAGLVNTLTSTGVIKNLDYEITASYARGSYTPYVSAFVFGAYGLIKDCYVKATMYPDRYTDSEGMLGVFSNEDRLDPVAYIYNTVFDLKVIRDGRITDDGYVVRFGSNGCDAIDCVFIKNSNKNDFYGQGANGGSSVEMENCYTYRTVYDFVNGINGYFVRSDANVPLVDGAVVYSNWGNVWSINKENIVLSSKPVVENVSFEYYNNCTLFNVKVDGGVLTWTNDELCDILIEGELVNTTSTKSFDIAKYVMDNYDIVSKDYNVIIKNDKFADSILFKFRVLTQENFIEVMYKSTTTSGNEYMVLTENVVINDGKFGTVDGVKRTREEYDALSADKKHNNSSELQVYQRWYAFGGFTATLNGRGYKLTLDLSNVTSSPATSWSIGGLFKEVTGCIENLQYEYLRNDYVDNENTGRSYAGFAGYIKNDGIIKNCYLTMNVERNGYKQLAQEAIIANIQNDNFINNVMSFNVTSNGELIDAGRAILSANTNCNISDCIWINNSTDIVSQTFMDDDSDQYYTTYNSFIELASDANSMIQSSDVWQIRKNGVLSLCGRMINAPQFDIQVKSDRVLMISDARLTYEFYVYDTTARKYVYLLETTKNQLFFYQIRPYAYKVCPTAKNFTIMIVVKELSIEEIFEIKNTYDNGITDDSCVPDIYD